MPHVNVAWVDGSGSLQSASYGAEGRTTLSVRRVTVTPKTSVVPGLHSSSPARAATPVQRKLTLTQPGWC